MPLTTPPPMPPSEAFFPGKLALKVQDITRRLQISDDQVRGLVDQGQLVALAVNDDPKVKRQHLRIETWSVEAWLLEKAAEMGTEIPYRESERCRWWRSQLREQARALKPKVS
jgi:hypothetical protein